MRSLTNRVTRWACEKIAQNVAGTIFVIYIFSFDKRSTNICATPTISNKVPEENNRPKCENSGHSAYEVDAREAFYRVTTRGHILKQTVKH
jgi:hypothetical protein